MAGSGNRDWCIVHNEAHPMTAECCRHMLDACHCRFRTATVTKGEVRTCIDCGRQLCIEAHPQAPMMR